MSTVDTKTTVNVTYGIMTMIYLLLVGVLNTLGIRIYQEDVIIPYFDKEKNKKEEFGEELETEVKKTATVNREAVTIIEAIMMAVTIPLAFGYIIGFDCSCAADGNANHVGKIVFCLGVFIPMVYIIVSEIIILLLPDRDWLNPFMGENTTKEEQDKHFFNKQYRKTLCWSIITLTFIIHFFTVAFGSNSLTSGGSVNMY